MKGRRDKSRPQAAEEDDAERSLAQQRLDVLLAISLVTSRPHEIVDSIVGVDIDTAHRRLSDQFGLAPHLAAYILDTPLRTLLAERQAELSDRLAAAREALNKQTSE